MPATVDGQENYRRKVMTRLVNDRMSISTLAKLLRKRRETVSRAIHHRHKGKTAKRILETLNLP